MSHRTREAAECLASLSHSTMIGRERPERGGAPFVIDKTRGGGAGRGGRGRGAAKTARAPAASDKPNSKIRSDASQAPVGRRGAKSEAATDCPILERSGRVPHFLRRRRRPALGHCDRYYDDYSYNRGRAQEAAATC
ncbi:hypothetical protein EVAR_526_1 [Eumeta japonica]|uniref:Uncharacterized protein n=1 Tax=Eumeta variegata TaxID=151549 RepID=A0A4C1SB16_EUMVA|nr:hypothetical protein EVAR_526_1 [Eumeta japonica]